MCIGDRQVMLASFSNAHVCKKLAVIAMAVALPGSVMGAGGVSMLAVVAPLPSCRKPWPPQQEM